MTVEVAMNVAEAPVAEVVPSQNEPKVVEDCEDLKEAKNDESADTGVEKASSYREESNFSSDLKEFEKKALSDLKAKLEEAFAANSLFIKEEAKKPKAKPAAKEEEGKVEEAKPEAEGEDKAEKEPEEGAAECKEEKKEQKDVFLWGVPLVPCKSHEGTDVVLLKFLRAREFKVNEAFEMLKKTLLWRRESNIDSLLEEDLGIDLSSAFFMDGFDREGHPVCYNIFGAFANPELHERTFGSEESRKLVLRWRVQLMEKGIEKLDLRPGGITSILQISDLKNSPTPSKKELKAYMNQAHALLQDNYPELVARNIVINAPFWYYALNAILSPFMTQRTKNKFVVARPSRITETLLKYLPAEEIPLHYGGFKRENDFEFSKEDGEVVEAVVKAASIHTIEIPAEQAGTTLIWDIVVLGWDVNYKEEFTCSDEGSYSIIVQKEKKLNHSDAPIRNTFKANEPGKVVLTINNSTGRKKKVLYRSKVKKAAC